MPVIGYKAQCCIGKKKKKTFLLHKPSQECVKTFKSSRQSVSTGTAEWQVKWFLSFWNDFSEISDARNIRLYSQTKPSGVCRPDAPPQWFTSHIYLSSFPQMV